MRKHLWTIIFGIVLLAIGYWWYFTFTYVPTATLIYNNNGVEETYIIAYPLTSLIVKNEVDSAYIFYDKNGKSLIIVNDIDWNKLKIIKN